MSTSKYLMRFEPTEPEYVMLDPYTGEPMSRGHELREIRRALAARNALAEQMRTICEELGVDCYAAALKRIKELNEKARVLGA